VVVPRDKRCVDGCSSMLSMAVGADIGPAAAGRAVAPGLRDSRESEGAATEIVHHILQSGHPPLLHGGVAALKAGLYHAGDSAQAIANRRERLLDCNQV